MSTSFIKKSRGEMFSYNRSNAASYINSNGEVQTAPPSVIRMNYDEKWGNFKGIKFGDGDYAHIPTEVNMHWRPTPTGATLIAIGQAPQGVIWFKLGEVEIEGVDGHKLHIIELPPEQVATLPDSIQIFPNKDDIEQDCHLMLVKYYHETTIDFGVEAEAMDELNTFLHGAWH